MQQSTTERPRVLAALMLAQVLSGLGHGVTFSMGSLLAADLAGAAWGGAASTVTTIGAALWAMPLARIVRARGRRASLSTGLLLGLLGAVAAMAGAQTRVFILVLLGFLLLGGAVAMNLQARFAAADVATDDTRGRDISLVIWATTIGAVLGPNLFEPTERLGAALGLAEFSGAYLVCILAQLLALAGLWFLLPPTPPSAEAARTTTKVRLVEHPVVVSAIVSIATAHFAMIAIMSMTAVHMHGHGASMTLIGLTISFHVAGMYALAPVFGVLSDKVGARAVISLGVGMMLAAAALLVFWSADDTVVVIALLLLGLGWSAVLVGASALLTGAAPEEHRAGLQGRSDVAMNVTGALGGVVAGPVVSTFGMPVMAGIVIALVVGQLVVSALLRRRAGQQGQPSRIHGGTRAH